MEDWDELRTTVATKPLAEAIQHITYALKTDVVAAHTAAKLLHNKTFSEEEHEEMLTLIEQRLARAQDVINQIIIATFAPRLTNENEDER